MRGEGGGTHYKVDSGVDRITHNVIYLFVYLECIGTTACIEPNV